MKISNEIVGKRHRDAFYRLHVLPMGFGGRSGVNFQLN